MCDYFPRDTARRIKAILHQPISYFQQLSHAFLNRLKALLARMTSQQIFILVSLDKMSHNRPRLAPWRVQNSRSPASSAAATRARTARYRISVTHAVQGYRHRLPARLAPQYRYRMVTHVPGSNHVLVCADIQGFSEPSLKNEESIFEDMYFSSNVLILIFKFFTRSRNVKIFLERRNFCLILSNEFNCLNSLCINCNKCWFQYMAGFLSLYSYINTKTQKSRHPQVARIWLVSD